MSMTIDEAWSDYMTFRINRRFRGVTTEGSDLGDFAARDTNVLVFPLIACSVYYESILDQ